MTEQQAIKYLFCSGMSDLQVNTVVKAIREPYIKAFEDIRAEIVFERDRRIGGEFYESAKYASFDKALEIIDRNNPSKAESVGDPDKLEKETI